MNETTEDLSTESERPLWLDPFIKLSQVYIIPSLCCFGILSNLSSVGALLGNILHLHKSLVVLFSFLNISDICFLICTFFVFGLPNVSPTYKMQYSGYWIPYILPTLQTFLTISVYATVAIAVNGAMEVKSALPDPHGSCWSRMLHRLESRRINGLTVTIIGILVGSVIFNFTRWGEVTTGFAFDEDLNQTIPIPVNTIFREHPVYVLSYSMVGSTVIMIFIPMAVLITSCVILMKAIPEGAQRKKILRIMLVIIIMFITCHSPKVILTGYEIATFEEPGKAAVWAIVMKEISHILLVCYSAFNPIACCGELLCRSILLPLKKAWTRCFPKKTYMESEFVQMKSIGVTINGSATVPMDQQLAELDAQSRLLTGINISSEKSDREKDILPDPAMV